MNSKTLRAMVEVTRPLNTVIAGISVGAAVVLWQTGTLHWAPVLGAALAAAFVAAGANAVNDCFDVEIDRINKPNRPLARGDLSTVQGMFVWACMSAIGVTAAAVIGTEALGIAAFSVVLLYFYSRTFKRTMLWGNIVVAFMTGLAFLFAGVAAGNILPSLVPALFAFLINFARELVKDAEDLRGDRAGAARTLAVRYGPAPGIRIAQVTLVFLITTTIVAAWSGVYSHWFSILIVPVDAVIVLVLLKLRPGSSPEELGVLSRYLKYDMLLGLVAVVAGSLGSAR